MSNSERRARRNLGAMELKKYVDETGHNLSKVIARGATDKHKLERTSEESWKYLLEIEELKLKCEPKSKALSELMELEDNFTRIIAGVQAITEMPKQAQKHRQAVLDLYTETQDRLINVRHFLAQ